MRKEIYKEMFDRYELYLKLKSEMEAVYAYKWPKAMYYGTIEWHESTDKLSDILYKLREGWIGSPEWIEEV